MAMIRQWINNCLVLARAPGDHYKPNTRKVFRDITFNLGPLDDSISLRSIGYTQSKITTLARLYTHVPSLDMARQLWDFYRDGRTGTRNNDSVSFSTYGHLIKNKMVRRTGVSAMGPCLQSVVITSVEDVGGRINLFYRTSDLLKKFPADLIFVRTLIQTFSGYADGEWPLCVHFANLTVAAPYFPVLFPHIPDIPRELDRIKRTDKQFHTFIVQFASQYYCPEHARGIDGYSQTRALKKFALQAVTDKRTLKTLREYLRDEHPGYQRAYKPRGLTRKKLEGLK
jgi:hypothetical protein